MDQVSVDGIHVETDGAGPPVVLTGSGHLPHLELPDAFTRVVHEFLAKG